MKSVLILLTVVLLISKNGNAQGCVAVRNLAGFGQFAALGYKENANKWMLDINNRYFEAHQAFKGTKNVTPPNPYNALALYEYTLNMELSRTLKGGWVLAFDLPIAYNTAASTVEHLSGVRHSTSAFGIGDIRFTAYKWLLSDDKPRRGNIQFGLGLKFPTANYHSMDYFYDNPADHTQTILWPVNVAIQPGDGGTGITATLNAFYIFNKQFSLYSSFFYLSNPVNVNGVSAVIPGSTPSPTIVKATADVNSVPDNYTLRAGANYTRESWVLSAGFRYEGAPAIDLIGHSDGLRRVGHIFSVEPGLLYKFSSSFLYTFVTIPLHRATIQTVPDQRITQMTGVYTITGGDFASTLIFLGYAFTF